MAPSSEIPAPQSVSGQEAGTSESAASEKALRPAPSGNTPRLAIRYFGHEDDEGYKRLLATCSYFHGSVPVFVALPKEKRNVRLAPEYSIEWNREICEILIRELGIENVSLF